MFEHFKIYRKILVVNSYKPIDKGGVNEWKKYINLQNTFSITSKVTFKKTCKLLWVDYRTRMVNWALKLF